MERLNFSDQPIRQPQSVPLPTTVPSAGDVTAVADRVDVTETDIATLQGDVVALDGRLDILEIGLNALGDYADDAAAAGGGVSIGERYRTGSILKVRIA